MTFWELCHQDRNERKNSSEIFVEKSFESEFFFKKGKKLKHLKFQNIAHLHLNLVTFEGKGVLHVLQEWPAGFEYFLNLLKKAKL